MIYPSILKTVGNTPAVKINNLAPEGINFMLKQNTLTQLHLLKIDWL